MPQIPGTMFGQFVYPGLEPWPRGNSNNFAQYVNSQGITPGIITVEAPIPLPQVGETGDAVFTDGVGGVLVVPDCRVADFTPHVSGGGQSVTLYLEDHRWRWKLGEISGLYNVPEDRRQVVPLVPIPGQPVGNPPELPPPRAGEEPIRPETKKTAPELVKLCLKAMQEDRYTIRGIDSQATPYTSWDAANPAQALQALVESLGCRVMWDNAKQAVVIDKQGDGAELPGGAVLSAAFSLKPKPRPSKVKLYGARKRWQMRFALEAVGMDFDGSWRPLNKLSYRPTSGDDSDWGRPPWFPGVIEARALLPGGRKWQDAVALARRYVWRAYRIKETRVDGSGKLSVPPSGWDRGRPADPKDYKKRRQVRLLPYKLQLTKDDIGRYTLAGAACYGVHEPPHFIGNGQDVVAVTAQTSKKTEVKVPFSIIEEQQVIVFDLPVLQYDQGAKKVKPADIVLECACEVTANDTGQFVRYPVEQRVPGGISDQPHVFVNESLEYKAVVEYGDNNDVKGMKDNAQLIKPRADYYIAGELERLVTDVGEDATYPGVRPEIQPDGAVQQVTVTIGGGEGPSTRASRNTEHQPYLPNYLGRRQVEESGVDAQRYAKEKNLQTLRQIVNAGKGVAGAVADFFAPGANGAAAGGGG